MTDFYAAEKGWQKGLPEPSLRRAADGRLVVAAGGTPVREPARMVLTDAEWERLRAAPVPPVVEPEPEPAPTPEPEPPPVVIGPVADWANPTTRAKRVERVTDPPFEEDTEYVDCPGLVVPRNAKRFTVVGGINLPTITAGWQDFWVGGREGQPMNAGPRTDGKDLNQTKMWPVPAGDYTQDGVFAFLDLHDVSRPAGSSAHPDGFQIMCALRVTWGGCVFRNMGEAVQPWFVKGEGPDAGGGPVEDLSLTDSRFERIAHYYPVRVSQGVAVPTRITLRNVDLGGKNAAVCQSAIDAGFVAENVTGGQIKVTAN